MTKADVLRALQDHVGKENGITAEDLVRKICGFKLEPSSHMRRLRKCISELRLDGAVVCGHPSTGYYLAATAEELNDTCKFLYSRAMASLNQVSRMKKIALPDLRGQLRLPVD